MTNLPQRADLLPLSGNGSDLDLSFRGGGKLDIELRDRGAETVRIAGADGATVGSDAG